MTLLPKERIYVVIDCTTGLPYGGTGRGYSKYRPVARLTKRQAEISARAISKYGPPTRVDTYIRIYGEEDE